MQTNLTLLTTDKLNRMLQNPYLADDERERIKRELYTRSTAKLRAKLAYGDYLDRRRRRLRGGV